MTKPDGPDIRARLKDAARRQIKASGGLEAAAAITRVGKSELAHYQSPNHPSRFMPVDVLADLMRDSKATDVVDVLASSTNHALMPVDPQGNSLTADIVTLAEKAARVFHDFCCHCNKGAITPDVADQLDRDLEEVIVTAMHARAIARSAGQGKANGALAGCGPPDDETGKTR